MCKFKRISELLQIKNDPKIKLVKIFGSAPHVEFCILNRKKTSPGRQNGSTAMFQKRHKESLI
jgi:hypothetical protein